MNKWIVSACLLVLTAAPAVAGDVRLDSYRHPEKESFRLFNKMYLDGVRGGFMAYNAWLRRHGSPAFCMPGDLLLTTEQTEEIMFKAADKRAAKGDTPVSLVLLWGMQDTYPCEKTDGQ
jgi:hypothetical protein